MRKEPLAGRDQPCHGQGTNPATVDPVWSSDPVPSGFAFRFINSNEMAKLN